MLAWGPFPHPTVRRPETFEVPKSRIASEGIFIYLGADHKTSKSRQSEIQGCLELEIQYRIGLKVLATPPRLAPFNQKEYAQPHPMQVLASSRVICNITLATAPTSECWLPRYFQHSSDYAFSTLNDYLIMVRLSQRYRLF